MSATIKLTAKARIAGTSDFGGPDYSPVIDKLYELGAGAGADQFDQVFYDERQYAASVADTLDLAGVLTSAFGQTITFAEVMGLIIINESRAGVRSLGTLTVGAGSNPYFPWLAATGDGVKVFPGGTLALIAPDAAGFGGVTPSTGDILTITPNANAGTYQIAIFGRSS